MGALTKCRACGNDVAKTAKQCPKCGAPRSTGSLVGKLVGLLVCAAVVGTCVSAIRGSRNEGTSTVNAASAQAIPVSAEELMSAYTANEVAADGRYKGKVVVVSGSVTTVGKDILDNMYVTLQTKDSFREIQCSFDKSHEGELARLKKRDRVTIRGQVDGLMGNVGLSDSVLQ